jgi:hypothetical protein
MNTEYEEQELLKLELDGAYKDQKLAAEQNQELHDESRKIFAELYDKILLYSAGAFSFSATLIGLVVSNKIDALSKVGFIFHNVYWLYGSMSSFLLVCFLVLLSKRFDAEYTAVVGMVNYIDKSKAKEESLIKALNKMSILITKGGTKESELTTARENISKYEVAYLSNSKLKNRSYLIMYYSHLAAEIMVLTGTLLLLLFVIQLSQAIIWG